MSPAPYTASCVRACALRGALVRPGEWQVLAGLGSTGSVIEWLKNRGLVAADAADVLTVERSAHEAVIRNASAFLRFAREPLDALLRCFVHYYDLLNIEGVVHRIHALPDEGDHPPGRFYDTGTFGRLRPATLHAVTNYPALARALRHTLFAAPFEAALLHYHEDEDVVRLVERVEVAFFADWVEAAERCGLHPGGAPDTSALGVFLVARAIEAVVRLKAHRGADTSRVLEWLAPVASAARQNACLDVLSRDTEPDPVQKLVGILLPAVSRSNEMPQELGPRGKWGFLDRLVMRQALKATRGISFNADFLTGFLVRQTCQARELTVLLESREANIAVPAFTPGGGKG